MAMSSGPGTVRDGAASISIVDAGLCSKISHQLPVLASFFSKTSHAISGLMDGNKTQGGAIANLQQSQASFNNQANFFNFWFRQISSQVDGAGLALSKSNESLSDFATKASDIAPGIPTALSLLPGPSVGMATFYFIPPSYTGTTPLNYSGTPFEIQMYDSVTKAQVGEAGTTLTTPSYVLTGPLRFEEAFATEVLGVGMNEFYDLYKTELWMATIQVALTAEAQPRYPPFCVKIRAFNTSGVEGSELPGAWSAPTMLCQVAMTVPQPKITTVITGVNSTLLYWSTPKVLQPDGTLQPWSGIQCWDIVTDGTTSHLLTGTATTGMATIVADSTSKSLTIQGYSTRTEALNKTQASTLKSDPFQYTPSINIPKPTLNVTIRSETIVTAQATIRLRDYYESNTLTYEVTAVNQRDFSTLSSTMLVPATTQPFANTHGLVPIVLPDEVRGDFYVFTATVTDSFAHVSPSSNSIGPLFIPFATPTPTSEEVSVVVTQNSVTIAITPSLDHEKNYTYDVTLSGSSYSGPITSSTGGAHTYVFNELHDYVTYHVRVRAFDGLAGSAVYKTKFLAQVQPSYQATSIYVGDSGSTFYTTTASTSLNNNAYMSIDTGGSMAVVRRNLNDNTWPPNPTYANTVPYTGGTASRVCSNRDCTIISSVTGRDSKVFVAFRITSNENDYRIDTWMSKTIEYNSSTVQGVSLNSDGTTLVIANIGGQLIAYSRTAGPSTNFENPQIIHATSTEVVTDVVLSADGRTVVKSIMNGVVRVFECVSVNDQPPEWNPVPVLLVDLQATNNTNQSVALSADGTTLVVHNRVYTKGINGWIGTHETLDIPNGNRLDVHVTVTGDGLVIAARSQYLQKTRIFSRPNTQTPFSFNQSEDITYDISGSHAANIMITPRGDTLFIYDAYPAMKAFVRS